jgi:hypothetical protein
MSRKNRLRVYNELVATGRLDRDDGALVREFGVPIPPVEEPVEEDQPVEEEQPTEEEPEE